MHINWYHVKKKTEGHRLNQNQNHGSHTPKQMPLVRTNTVAYTQYEIELYLRYLILYSYTRNIGPFCILVGPYSKHEARNHNAPGLRGACFDRLGHRVRENTVSVQTVEAADFALNYTGATGTMLMHHRINTPSLGCPKSSAEEGS